MQIKANFLITALLLCGSLFFAACYTVESSAELTVSSAFPANEIAQEMTTAEETLTSIGKQIITNQENEQTTDPPPETASKETMPEKTVPTQTSSIYYTVIPPEQTTIGQQEPTIPGYLIPYYSTTDNPSPEEEKTQPSSDGGSLEGANVPVEYDLFSPVPEGQMQDTSYFDDAIFIGNSRMLGFGEYSKLENIRVFASAGLSVRTIYNEKSFETPDGKITIMDALAQTPAFGKVYLKIGMNELGWEYPEVFIKEYVQLINKIKEYSPDAVIYIHSILPVSKKKSTIDPWENQPRINEYNELLLKMCGENGYHYLDVQSIYLDEEGFLQTEVSFDGSHIRSNHYQPWVDYLLCHTVENISTEPPMDEETEEASESLP